MLRSWISDDRKRPHQRVIVTYVLVSYPAYTSESMPITGPLRTMDCRVGAESIGQVCGDYFNKHISRYRVQAELMRMAYIYSLPWAFPNSYY